METNQVHTRALTYVVDFAFVCGFHSVVWNLLHVSSAFGQPRICASRFLLCRLRSYAKKDGLYCDLTAICPCMQSTLPLFYLHVRQFHCADTHVVFRVSPVRWGRWFSGSRRRLHVMPPMLVSTETERLYRILDSQGKRCWRTWAECLIRALPAIDCQGSHCRGSHGNGCHATMLPTRLSATQRFPLCLLPCRSALVERDGLIRESTTRYPFMQSLSPMHRLYTDVVIPYRVPFQGILRFAASHSTACTFCKVSDQHSCIPPVFIKECAEYSQSMSTYKSRVSWTYMFWCAQGVAHRQIVKWVRDFTTSSHKTMSNTSPKYIFSKVSPRLYYDLWTLPTQMFCDWL